MIRVFVDLKNELSLQVRISLQESWRLMSTICSFMSTMRPSIFVKRRLAQRPVILSFPTHKSCLDLLHLEHTL